MKDKRYFVDVRDQFVAIRDRTIDCIKNDEYLTPCFPGVVSYWPFDSYFDYCTDKRVWVKDDYIIEKARIGCANLNKYEDENNKTHTKKVEDIDSLLAQIDIMSDAINKMKEIIKRCNIREVSRCWKSTIECDDEI